MTEDFDTKKFLPIDETEKRLLQPKEIIKQAAYIGFLSRGLFAVDEQGKLDTSIFETDYVKDVISLIENDWDMYSFLSDRATQNENPEKLLSLFIDEARLVKQLRVEVVDPSQMADPNPKNPVQMDYDDTGWILKISNQYIPRVRQETHLPSIPLAQELAHEFFAWRLFSRVPLIQRDQIISHKQSTNPVINFSEKSFGKTHVLDIIFSEIIQGKRRGAW